MCFYSFALSSYVAINEHQQHQQQHQQSTWGCHTIATVTFTHWKSFLDGIFTLFIPTFCFASPFHSLFYFTCLVCVRLIAHLFKLTTVSIARLAKCFWWFHFVLVKECVCKLQWYACKMAIEKHNHRMIVKQNRLSTYTSRTYTCTRVHRTAQTNKSQST